MTTGRATGNISPPTSPPAEGRAGSSGFSTVDAAADGGSYGGGFAWLALTDPDWKSPAGKDMRVAAVATKYGWTSLVESLVPNGADRRDALRVQELVEGEQRDDHLGHSLGQRRHRRSEPAVADDDGGVGHHARLGQPLFDSCVRGQRRQ